MLNQLAQQFLGGGAESLSGQELHGNVGQLLQGADGESVAGAISGALGALGPSGFGESVRQGTASYGSGGGLAETLLQAVERGGGSRPSVLSQFGGGSGGSGVADLAGLAMHVAENHPQALAQVLGGQLGGGGGGGSGLLHMLGNPMVRQVGMQLAQRYL